jgi:hypothetical protein
MLLLAIPALTSNPPERLINRHGQGTRLFGAPIGAIRGSRVAKAKS